MSLDKRFAIEQPDGARWNVFHDGEDPARYAIFTSAGREVMLRDPSFNTLMGQYRALASGELTATANAADQDIRNLLGHGKEAHVYTMGRRFAVRETPGVDNFYKGTGALEMMNVVAGIIDLGTPRWLRTPEHFVRLSDPETERVYTVMRRVNDGITVEDIVKYPDTDHAEAVERHFKEVTPETIDTALRLFGRAHSILARLIEYAGLEPTSVLTDWKTRNVLIQRVRTPVAGEKHLLNVIDQY